MLFFSAAMAWPHWSSLPGSTYTAQRTLRPDAVMKLSSSTSSFAATRANR
jgi:hypothetical protein